MIFEVSRAGMTVRYGGRQRAANQTDAAAMFDGLEKRKFQCLKIPLDVVVEVISFSEVPRGSSRISIKSRNISKGGICLEAKSIELNGVNLISGLPFARENRLRLSMELIPHEPPFTAIGEVQWYDIDREMPEFIYRIGVVFLEIKNNGKDQLSRFLKSA